MENLGFLVVCRRQWFTSVFLQECKRKWGFRDYHLLSLPGDSPDQLKQIEDSQLQGCKQVAITAQTIGNSKKLWESTDIEESHTTLKYLAWDSNSSVPKGSRDLSHCSTQRSTEDFMTEGVAVVIILVWVPPGPPSSSLPAALPKPWRRGKAQRGMFVARLSPISQSKNNDWLFLWASLEKNPALLGGRGRIFFANKSNSNQESSGMYIHCDSFHLSSGRPRNSEEVFGSHPRKDDVAVKPLLPEA